MNRNKQIHLLLSILLLSLSCNAQAQTGKLYKWVDKDGRITYQESPPPKKAKILKEENLSASSSSKRSSNAKGETSPVIVYTIPQCNNCVTMINELEKLGVPYTEKNLNEDREAQNRILAKTNSIKAPALFVKDELISVSDNIELANKLKQAGYVISEPRETNTNRSENSNDSGSDVK